MAFKTTVSRASPRGRGVVKQASNRIPTSYYVNAAAVGVAILIAVLAVRGLVTKEDMPQCSDRFGNGTLFGLQDKSGRPIGTNDLQARLGGRDWGLMDNLELVAITGGPAPVAMRVGLPRLAAKPDDDKPVRSGAGFTWLLPKLATATAACLTYSIRLPEDFNFGAGGGLPGLFGGETNDAPSAARSASFAVRNGWGENGAARVRIATTENTKGLLFTVDPDRQLLERGRWIRIEQEVVLNRPGAEDGSLRIWVDGKLRFENTRMVLRKGEGSLFRGVLADVHYGDTGQMLQAVPKSTALQVTPFEVRWQ
jgi:hypothetical protein